MRFNRETFFDRYRDAFGKLTQPRVDALSQLLDFVEADKEWGDLRHIAYFFATVKHETADTFEPIKEYRARAGSKGRANQDRYWLTGFYGRGFVQLTWERNYRTFTPLIGVNLVKNPNLALEPKYSYQIAAVGMRKGLFTGKALGDYISHGRSDYHNARRVINGTDKAAHIAGLARQFESILNASLSAAPATAAPTPTSVSTSIPIGPPEPATSATEQPPAPAPETTPQGQQTQTAAPTEGVLQSAGTVLVEAAKSQTTKEKAWAWLTGGGFLAVLNYFEERPVLVLAAGVVAGLLIYHFTARIRQKSQQAHEITKLTADFNSDPSRKDVEVIKK